MTLFDNHFMRHIHAHLWCMCHYFSIPYGRLSTQPRRHISHWHPISNDVNPYPPTVFTYDSCMSMQSTSEAWLLEISSDKRTVHYHRGFMLLAFADSPLVWIMAWRHADHKLLSKPYFDDKKSIFHKWAPQLQNVNIKTQKTINAFPWIDSHDRINAKFQKKINKTELGST